MKLSNSKRKFYPQISIKQINRNVWQITVALGPPDVKERADAPRAPQPQGTLQFLRSSLVLFHRLAAIGRYFPHGSIDILVPFTVKLRPRRIGADSASCSEAILKSLMEQDSASAGEIRREFGFSGYRCASMLSALYREGKLTRTGRGTKAAPFRYSVRPEGVEQ